MSDELKNGLLFIIHHSDFIVSFEVVMMNNGRPQSRKQTLCVAIALTILVWATQTLLKQWGYGQQLDQAEPAERFVPQASGVFGGCATLEVRSEATIIGSQVKLRQVCRWSERENAVFEPIGDLVLTRLSSGTPFQTISVEQIRRTLQDAGVNVAVINFAGPTSCTVARSDVEYDQTAALEQWIAARELAAAQQEKPSTQPLAVASKSDRPATLPADNEPIRTLRDELIADLANRLGLPVDNLQVTFRNQDQNVLNISRPLFSYEIEPVRANALGKVIWNVTIRTDTGSRKVTIAAEARAWQDQVVVAKPLAFRQVIRSEDVVQRRALVDQLSDDPLLSLDQAVGQQAARELKPGTVLTARMIDPVQLVRTGQFVTVTLEQGTVKIKTVARAMESGTYGQTIRVKNEATKDVFQVVLTGPQTATMNLSAATQN